MGLSGKQEFQVAMKSPGDVVLDIFGTKKDQMPKICPHMMPRIELLQGQWGTPGCLLVAHFIFDGKSVISKETVESVDVENKSITYNLLEGEIKKPYKTIKVTVQANQPNLMKFTMKYEKINEDYVPDLDKLVDFLVKITQQIDAHLVQAGIV